MVKKVKKGISELVYLEDLDLRCNVSGSLAQEYTASVSGFTPFFTDSSSHIDYSVYASPTYACLGDDVVYSFLLRREKFVNNISELSKEIQHTFQVQIQDNEVKPYYKNEFEENDVVVYNTIYGNVTKIDSPGLEEISTLDSFRNDFVVFDDELNKSEDNLWSLAVEDSAYQYNFLWSKTKNGEISFQIRRVFDYSNGSYGEALYHSNFNLDMAKCSHADSHFFSYDEDGLEKRLKGDYMAPLKVIEKDGKKVKSKFYHFYADLRKNNISSYKALVLAESFFEDPRVSKYLSKLIKDTKKYEWEKN